jgi:hypothetical protein
MSSLQRIYFRNLKMTGYHELGIRNQGKDQLRVKSTWIVTHGYMKAIAGILLYSYP